jgi:hypothetical protein
MPDIQLRGLETDGITLISPAAAEFDSLVQSLFKGNANLLLRLKPFLTVLSSNSDRTIVAFALKWTTPSRINLSQHKYPDAITGMVTERGNEILPGEQRIVAKGIEIDSGFSSGQATEDYYLHQFVAMFAAETTTTLQIEVDATILSDGTLLGADESDLATDFALYLKAKQDLYHSIIDLLDKGHPFEEAFRPLDAARAEKPALSAYHRDPFSIYLRLALQETDRWREQHGEASLDLIRQALVKQPFVVQRIGTRPPE